ncbi:MAG: alpha/beta hydrolase, partial [Ginsengibacter sp.]
PPEEPTTFDVDVRDITYTGKEDESRTAEQTEFNIPWQYHLSDWIENYKSIDYHGQNNLDNFKLSPLSGYTRARVGSPPGGKESGYRDYTYIRNINNNPTPEIDPGGDVTVFYGTNRNREDDDKTDNYYGSELSALQQGLCVISIPPGHKQGALERPGKILWWRQSENPAKHIILRSIEPLTDSDYYNYLNKGFNNSDKKAALIFVHGFNTSFAESAWRCGQIAYDIPFPGITGFFSWPSGGKALDYLRDIERADASVSPLTQFIEDIVLHTHVEELHFIAHSMGNRILTRSLNQLIQKDSFKNSVATIAQIVLAAPDIDRDVFNNEIYPEFKGIGTRRTLYASNQDKALFLSEKLRIGLKRLGEGGADIYIADGIDTVDASNIISTGIHHSYIFEGKELLYDLNMLFIGGISPNKRRLRKMAKQVSGKTMNYWLFR